MVMLQTHVAVFCTRAVAISWRGTTQNDAGQKGGKEALADGNESPFDFWLRRGRAGDRAG